MERHRQIEMREGGGGDGDMEERECMFGECF